MNEYFKVASDLDDIELNNNSSKETNEYFKPAGDLNDTKSISDFITEETSFEKINDYLSTIVSGQEYPNECELGKLCSMGSMILSLEQVIEMANDPSYNIIKAEYFNPQMISIKFQQYIKTNNKHF